jgi:hypothetical protein
LTLTTGNANVPREAALKAFCEKFFQNHENAASLLSPFGVLGFAPEEENFEVYWSQACISWARTKGGEKLEAVNSLIHQHQKKMLEKWIPKWYVCSPISRLNITGRSDRKCVLGQRPFPW